MVFAQIQIKPGFSLFSVEQDQAIGRQSADAAKHQLPILHDRSIEAFVDGIGKRLAAVAPGAKYPYQFEIVNVETRSMTLWMRLKTNFRRNYSSRALTIP